MPIGAQRRLLNDTILFYCAIAVGNEIEKINLASFSLKQKREYRLSGHALLGKA